MYMKKIFGLIAILVITMGCDDGDMIFKTFDFSSVTNVESCDNNNTGNTVSNTVIFKIKGTEVIVLDLDPTALVNEATYNPETQKDNPRNVTIDGVKNKIKYTNYKGTVTKAMLCGGALSSLPDVIDQWNGTGNLSIRTDEVRKAGKLTGYTHQITLANISFKNGEETITINNNLFGSRLVNLDVIFNFVPDGQENPKIQTCPNNSGLIYTSKGNEALILSLQAGAIPSVVGSKAITLGGLSNQNLVVFKVFGSPVTTDNICNTIITPIVKQHWPATSGQIIINTTAGVGTSLIHEIRLKDVEFTNSKGETLLISDIATVTSQGYLFGFY